VNRVKNIAMKELNCVAAAIYCHMNLPYDLSVNIVTAMSTCGSSISPHFHSCLSRYIRLIWTAC